MKDKKQTQNGFTLIEMLVVIAIIILLAALIYPAVQRALMQARQTKCISNLRSFGLAWNQYYLDVTQDPFSTEADASAPWLSSMVPEYLSDTSMFVCPSDVSRGTWGSKPAGVGESELYRTRDTNDFPETDDNANNPASGQWARRNPIVERNSYMYEFNDADCTWAEGFVYRNREGDLLGGSDLPMSWGQVKLLQQRYGDRFSQSSYDRTQFPLVRCFHHYGDRNVIVRNTFDNRNETSFRVLNVSMAGNTFISGLQWEYPLAR